MNWIVAIGLLLGMASILYIIIIVGKRQAKKLGILKNERG